MRKTSTVANVPRKATILMVGDSGVGKTALMLRLCRDKFDAAELRSTVGIDHVKHLYEFRPGVAPPISSDTMTSDVWAERLAVLGANQRVELQFWDTAGQERFQSLTSAYYRGGDIVFVVYDITNVTSFSATERWMGRVRDLCARDALVALVGNKADLVDSRVVSLEAGRAKATQLGIPHFFETSARHGINTASMLECMLLYLIVSSKWTQPPTPLPVYVAAAAAPSPDAEQKQQRKQKKSAGRNIDLKPTTTHHHHQRCHC
jgi:small GTP-binding protein